MKKYLLPLLFVSSLQAATTYYPITWDQVDTNDFTTNGFSLGLSGGALSDKMDADRTFSVGEITGWADGVPAFSVDYVPSFLTLHTNGIQIDAYWSGPPDIQFAASNVIGAIIVVDYDRPTYYDQYATLERTKSLWIDIKSWASTNLTFILPEDWISSSGVSVTELKAGELLTVVARLTHGGIYYEWRGDQSRPMGEIPGGTGNSRGVAQAPRWTRYTPAVVNVTNWPVELASGTRVIEDTSTNINIYSISGAPTDPTEVLSQVWTLRNTNTVAANSNKLTWATGINAIGFDTNYVWLTTNAYARLEFEVSSDVTNMINRFATTTTLGGGTGSSTPATLTNGLMAYLNFEEATDTTAEDQTANNRDFTPNSGAHFTPQKLGLANYCWTNSSKAGLVSRASTDLEPQSTGVRTYAFSFNAATLADYDTMIGQSGGAGNASWFVYRYGSTIRFRYSTDGTASSGLDSTLAISTGTDYHCVLEIDQDTNIAKMWVNNVQGVDMSYGADLFNSSAVISVFGRVENDTVSLQGIMDDFAVWNRALTSTERDTLYSILTAGGDTFAALDDAL